VSLSERVRSNSEAALWVVEAIIEMEAENTRLRTVVEELIDSADYWGEYDVPVGIVDRMRRAIESGGQHGND